MWIFTIPFTILSILTFPFSAINRYRFISLLAKTVLFWIKISCKINFKVKGSKNIPKTPIIFSYISTILKVWILILEMETY